MTSDFLLSPISPLFQFKSEPHLAGYVLSFVFIELSMSRNVVNLNA